MPGSSPLTEASATLGTCMGETALAWASLAEPYSMISDVTHTTNSLDQTVATRTSTTTPHEHVPCPAVGTYVRLRYAPDLHTSLRHCPHHLAARPRLRASVNCSRIHRADPGKQAESSHCRRGTAGRRHGRPRPYPSHPSSPQHLRWRPSHLARQSRPSAGAAAAAQRVDAAAAANRMSTRSTKLCTRKSGPPTVPSLLRYLSMMDTMTQSSFCARLDGQMSTCMSVARTSH